jgi:inorganic pyrophosphatase
MPGATKLYCRVEIPKGASLGRADATFERWPLRPAAIVCPVDCCYFPDTFGSDGEPLEAIVCASRPGSPGGSVAVKPIALLRTRGRRGFGEIVVCVPTADPTWSELSGAEDLPAPLREEIDRFVTRRGMRGAAAAVIGWCSREAALTAIDEAGCALGRGD